jgi:hypothetical protein
MSEIVVSGATYDDAIACSSVPAEEGWPVPVRRRVGRGDQYRYVGLTDGQRDLILSHLDDVLGCRQGYDGAAREAAVIRRDLKRNGWAT